MQHFGVVVNGKFKLGKQIGGGAFGEIYIGIFQFGKYFL